MATQLFPSKRMGTGALFFDSEGRLLIVKPTYREGWSIPGGVVEAGESPRQACVREVQEELGIDCPVGHLLCVDYCQASSDQTESLQFLFDGGRLTHEQIRAICLPEKELSDYRFCPPHAAVDLLTPKLGRRIRCWLENQEQGTLYLENQKAVF